MRKINNLVLTFFLLAAINEAPAGKLSINIQFPDNSLSAKQKEVFQDAKETWEKIIWGTEQIRENYTLNILADAKYIDNKGGILGQAGPTDIYTNTKIPVRGVMSFDKSDLNSMENYGTLNNVIIHEMGHVLGFGTTWSSGNSSLLKHSFQDYTFIGPEAMKVYTSMRYSPVLLEVPVENKGGAGTAGSHWREEVFGDELMTGYLNSAVDPISMLTLASFTDIGYKVNYAAADPYRLPTFQELDLLQKEPNAYRIKEIITPNLTSSILGGRVNRLY